MFPLLVSGDKMFEIMLYSSVLTFQLLMSGAKMSEIMLYSSFVIFFNYL
jgi:hypothetical protein